MALELSTSYMDSHRSQDFIEKAREKLKDLDYDTMVGIGFSGVFAILKLAPALGKNYLALRKPTDNSHSQNFGEGILGEKWLFVDDVVSTGETKRTVQLKIQQICESYDVKTQCVGEYRYQYNELVLYQ